MKNTPATPDRTDVRTVATPDASTDARAVFTTATRKNLRAIAEDQAAFTAALYNCSYGHFIHSANDRVLKLTGEKAEFITPIDAVRELALIRVDLAQAQGSMVASQEPIQNSPKLASHVDGIAVNFEALVKAADWKDSKNSRLQAEAVSKELQEYSDTFRNPATQWVTSQYMAKVLCTQEIGYGILGNAISREFFSAAVCVKMTPAGADNSN